MKAALKDALRAALKEYFVVALKDGLKVERSARVMAVSKEHWRAELWAEK